MRWREAARRLRRMAHLMVGVADYDAYARHRRVAHPGEPVMSRREFHRERMARRYGGGGMSRCC
jgi:uncharacterized short protein YbdD (DUF466 family)